MDALDHMTNKKPYISISTRLVFTKLDRMVAYNNKPETLASHVVLLKWKGEITRQIINLTFKPP